MKNNILIQKGNAKPILVTEKAFNAIYKEKGFLAIADPVPAQDLSAASNRRAREMVSTDGTGETSAAAIARELGLDGRDAEEETTESDAASKNATAKTAGAKTTAKTAANARTTKTKTPVKKSRTVDTGKAAADKLKADKAKADESKTNAQLTDDHGQTQSDLASGGTGGGDAGKTD